MPSKAIQAFWLANCKSFPLVPLVLKVNVMVFTTCKEGLLRAFSVPWKWGTSPRLSPKKTAVLLGCHRRKACESAWRHVWDADGNGNWFSRNHIYISNVFSPLEMISTKNGRHHCPGTRNFLFRLPSASQKRACLSSLLRQLQRPLQLIEENVP